MSTNDIMRIMITLKQENRLHHKGYLTRQSFTLTKDDPVLGMMIESAKKQWKMDNPDSVRVCIDFDYKDLP